MSTCRIYVKYSLYMSHIPFYRHICRWPIYIVFFPCGIMVKCVLVALGQMVNVKVELGTKKLGHPWAS